MSGCGSDIKVTNRNLNKPRGDCYCDQPLQGSVGNGDTVLACGPNGLAPMTLDIPAIPDPQALPSVAPGENVTVDVTGNATTGLVYTVNAVIPDPPEPYVLECPPTVESCPFVVEANVYDGQNPPQLVPADCVWICRDGEPMLALLRPPVKVVGDNVTVEYNSETGQITYTVTPTDPVDPVDPVEFDLKAALEALDQETSTACGDRGLACRADGTMYTYPICPGSKRPVGATERQQVIHDIDFTTQAVPQNVSGTIDLDANLVTDFCPGTHRYMLVDMDSRSRIDQVLGGAVNVQITSTVGPLITRVNVDADGPVINEGGDSDNYNSKTQVYTIPASGIVSIPYMIDYSSTSGALENTSPVRSGWGRVSAAITLIQC